MISPEQLIQAVGVKHVSLPYGIEKHPDAVKVLYWYRSGVGILVEFRANSIIAFMTNYIVEAATFKFEINEQNFNVIAEMIRRCVMVKNDK